jgi:hypothetical protein
MASRSGVPHRFQSPRSRHVDVDVDLTSIDADDYRAALDADGEDLRRVDLFGASDGGDGGNGMAMPSSNTSTVTTGALVATSTQQGWVQRPTTAMTCKNRKIRARTFDVWNDFEVVNGKKTRYADDATITRKSSLHCPLMALVIYLGIVNHVLVRLIVLLIFNLCLIIILMALLGIGITTLMLLILNSVI